MQAHGCEYTTAVHIDRGHIGTVPMDGVNWMQIGLGFGEDVKKNWVVVYVDQAATDAQFKALQGWMTEGMKGINEKKLPYLAGAFVGFKRVQMTWSVSKDGEEYATSIPGIHELRIRAIHNPGHPEPVTSTGIMDDFGNRFVHADTLVHTYKDRNPDLVMYDGWDLKGRQSNYAHFVLGTGVKADYVVGWGCWSAHQDFGSRDTYQERMVGHPKK